MLIRPCVCIPVFDNGETIQALVEEILEKTNLPVLVVDDGSTHPVKLQETSRLHLIRHPQNRGKGKATQAGFRWAIEENFTHLMTFDGDGQHLVSEISKLISEVERYPWALIIGNRIMNQSAPGISRFGRRFSNFWTRFETDHAIGDSQSGYRVYPLFHVQTMRFLTSRYEFEIEVLIRLLWRGVAVREVPVKVYYPPISSRVSHFRRFHDNLRISLLNAVLVVVSLLRLHTSKGKLSIALGLGVFVGCTPLFGLHTAIVALLSFVFRLNAAALFVGSQISIPPLAPWLAAASIRLGNIGEERGILSLAFAWWRGSLLLGLGLGGFAGALCYLVMKFKEGARAETADTRGWSGKIRGGRLGNGFMTLVVKYGGLRIAYCLLYFIVPYFYLFAPRGTRASLEYWKVLFPEEGWLRRSIRTLKHYYRFGTILIDRVFQGFSEDSSFFETRSNGFKNLEEMKGSRKGFLFVTLHAGAWDIPARYLAEKGICEQVHSFQHESKGHTFEKVRNRAGAEREEFSAIYANETELPVMEIKRLLESGKPVGLMCDRPTGGHVELVKFLGKIAAFDSTPFRIAATLEVPVLLSFAFKASGRCYQFNASAPKIFRYESGVDRSVQLWRWVQEFADESERYVRDNPYQWLNFFPFFSTAPGAPLNLPRSTSHLSYPATYQPS